MAFLNAQNLPHYIVNTQNFLKKRTIQIGKGRCHEDYLQTKMQGHEKARDVINTKWTMVVILINQHVRVLASAIMSTATILESIFLLSIQFKNLESSQKNKMPLFLEKNTVVKKRCTPSTAVMSNPHNWIQAKLVKLNNDPIWLSSTCKGLHTGYTTSWMVHCTDASPLDHEREPEGGTLEYMPKREKSLPGLGTAWFEWLDEKAG